MSHSTFNALLNMTAAALLIWGWFLIRRRNLEKHRKVMTGAFLVSCAFLVSYLLYHYNVGAVRYQKTGTIRTLYFAILITHSILAAIVAPMAIVTFRRGYIGAYARHRAIARWTLPIWIYVSITGVIVYLMLYVS